MTCNKLPFLSYRWLLLRQKSGNMMTEFASRWNLPIYQATSSTWSFSLGSTLFLPTGRAKKATIKVQEVPHCTFWLQAQHSSTFFFKFSLTRTKRGQECHMPYQLSKLQSLWEKGRPMRQSQHQQQQRTLCQQKAVDFSSPHHRNKSFCQAPYNCSQRLPKGEVSREMKDASKLPSSPFLYVCFRQPIFPLQIYIWEKISGSIFNFSKTFLQESPILTQVIKLSSHKTENDVTSCSCFFLILIC